MIKTMLESSQVLPPNDTRGPQILAVSWTTEALALFAVALRIRVRIKAQAIGWDDYFMCLALVCLLSALIRMELIGFCLCNAA